MGLSLVMKDHDCTQDIRLLFMEEDLNCWHTTHLMLTASVAPKSSDLVTNLLKVQNNNNSYASF
jgi:hypothetical protein